MDIQQLRLLAGRIRGLLEQSNVNVTHGQALDLSGALVGLRNWPEVQAFPARVAAADLDMAAASRLAYRLQKRHGLEISLEKLFIALRLPSSEGDSTGLPQIWPSGPRPGVYLTTRQDHINALLAVYEEATDGALVYGERACRHWEGSIELGEKGLWSNGLQRVPSGTLLVLGPIELNQESWKHAAFRLHSACIRAQAFGHRIAVLINTETPSTVLHDVDLMVRTQDTEGDAHEALLGTITAEGAMVVRSPLIEPLPEPEFRPSVAPIDFLPARAIPLLRTALQKRKAGLLFLGCSEIQEHVAIDLVSSVLPLTDSAGPAARIKSTPAKDWDAPEALKSLPFLPSIESAYAQGYRRLIVDLNHTDADLLIDHGSDVLFIASGCGSTVLDLFLRGIGISRYERAAEAVRLLVAILAVTHVKTTRLEVVAVPDLYIPDGSMPRIQDDSPEIFEILRRNRILRAEDELSELLDQKHVSPLALKEAVTPDSKWVADLLAQRGSAG